MPILPLLPLFSFQFSHTSSFPFPLKLCGTLCIFLWAMAGGEFLLMSRLCFSISFPSLKILPPTMRIGEKGSLRWILLKSRAIWPFPLVIIFFILFPISNLCAMVFFISSNFLPFSRLLVGLLQFHFFILCGWLFFFFFLISISSSSFYTLFSIPRHCVLLVSPCSHSIFHFPSHSLLFLLVVRLFTRNFLTSKIHL